MPHCGGETQTFVHRVRTGMLNDPVAPGKRPWQEEMDASGIYWGQLHYREAWRGAWGFSPVGNR